MKKIIVEVGSTVTKIDEYDGVEIKKLKESEAEEKIDINIKTWWTTYKGLIPDDIIAKIQVKTKE